MMISRETLILESNRTGFRAEILEKVIRLMDLLNTFATDEYLRSRIALKGGTALNLFHFDLPRLSVDIDLNYIGSIDRETMLAEKPDVITKIEKICSDKKYVNIRQPTEHAGGKWKMSYKSELIQQGNIEIDLNFISRASLWPTRYLDSNQIGHYQAKEIPVLDYYDLIGGKLSALFSRHKSRDLFDAYTIFANQEKLDKTKLKIAYLIYGASARIDIRNASLDHLHFASNELKNMLLPVLRKEALKETKDLKPWAENLINTCKENLREVITLTDKERDFLTRIIEYGEIVPELITEDPILIEIITHHPILLWKCVNVQKHNLRISKSDER
jgi:predicted nucleotidyltransferase component of viral defense system